MNPIEEVTEAQVRLKKALSEIEPPYAPNRFQENEVEFRLKTVADIIRIVLSDLRSMKEEWEK